MHTLIINSIYRRDISDSELEKFWKNKVSMTKYWYPGIKLEKYSIRSDNPSIDGINGSFL